MHHNHWLNHSWLVTSSNMQVYSVTFIIRHISLLLSWDAYANAIRYPSSLHHPNLLHLFLDLILMYVLRGGAKPSLTACYKWPIPCHVSDWTNFYYSLFLLKNKSSGKYWTTNARCHCNVPQAHYHLSGINILTLFFWQVSQRDHALHSDKTQSTGCTTTCSPTDRAWRTGGSSLLAVVMPTLLWHADERQNKTNGH